MWVPVNLNVCTSPAVKIAWALETYIAGYLLGLLAPSIGIHALETPE